MKHRYLLWALLPILLFISPALRSQALTIDVAYSIENGREVTASLQSYTTNERNYYISNNWAQEIFYADGVWKLSGDTGLGAWAVIATSSLDMGTMPPDFASGSWVSEEGFTLTKLEGSGTSASAPEFKIEVKADQHVSCFGGADGVVSGLFSNGTPPYTVTYTIGATTTTETTSNDANSLSGVPAGTFSVKVVDADGKEASTSVTVDQPDEVKVSTITQTNISCSGQADGLLDVHGQGGSGNYTYTWSTGATTHSINELTKGSYTVTVTDNAGCTAVQAFTVTEPSKLAATTTVGNVSCNSGGDGYVDLTVTGGTAPYTFTWNNTATTEDMAGLSAGTYEVTVTDAKGCTTTTSAEVVEPAKLTASAVATHISCNGGSDGSADLTVTGGTAPYTFAWNNTATTEDLTDLSTGTYAVTVTDANGCTATARVDVFEPVQLMASVKASDVSCPGQTDGTVDLTVAGGNPPYTYEWNNTATTEDMVGLSAGTYEVTITDGKGCTTTASAKVDEPVKIEATVSVTHVSCNGASNGAADLTVTGGNAPYTFVWSNTATTEDMIGLSAGTYDVTVTDANGCTATATAMIDEPDAIKVSVSATDVSCNGGADGTAEATVTGAVSPIVYQWTNDNDPCSEIGKSMGKCNPVVLEGESVSGLSAGSYTLRVTDGNGCTTTQSFEVTEPTKMIVSEDRITDVTCNGGNDGTASVTVSGGTEPYTYAWSNEAETAAITELSAGKYYVTVTDGNNCTATAEVTVNHPAALNAAIYVDSHASCNGAADGKASVTGTGGTPPYTYLWSTGATTDMPENFAAGTYQVTLTDANGCTATDEVTITEPAALRTTAVVAEDASCFGAADGMATVLARGGKGAYTYAWSDGTRNANVFDLAAGKYYVTVTDGNACVQTDSLTIGEPAEMQVSFTSTDDTGAQDGNLTVSTTMGEAPYIYRWKHDAALSADTLTGLAPATYTVTVQDANGCEKVDSVQIAFMGKACVSAIGIDSLLGADMNATARTRMIENGLYAGDTLHHDSLTRYFGGDTLYHPVYFSFTGDGNIYHIRTTDLDSTGGLTNTRGALFAGGCALDSLVKWNVNESVQDSNMRIEIQTTIGMEYTLLVDGGAPAAGRYSLEVQQVATTSVPTVREVAAIKVFPNPTSGQLTIERIDVREVSIFDGYGRRAARYVKPGNDIDISGLPTGIYYLRITDTDNGIYTSRVVKQ